MKKIITIALTCAFVGYPSLGASEVSGSFESLDGEFKHRFEKSGDYWGQVHRQNSEPVVVSGLYQSGENACWVTNRDGSKGAAGNVLIYIDMVQCCLELRKISNKFAVSKIWVEGSGAGYGLCNNQVLIKSQ